MALSSSPVPQHRMDVHAAALDAARTVLPALRSVPAPYRELADQATRAVTSVALNLAEGSGRFGRDRVAHYRIAYGSALEASAALEILNAIQAVSPAVAQNGLALLDRARAMTWRLIHPRM